MGIESISKLNTGWGICGFASVLGVLYNEGVIKDIVDAANKNDTLKFRLFAEIKTFLKLLESQGKDQILKDIQKFTRSFGEKYKDFTIQGFIQNINDLVDNGFDGNNDKYSIAMTTEAMVEYLKVIADKPNAIAVKTSVSNNNHVIVGVGTNSGKLRHWVYKVTDDEVYNWGKKVSLVSILNDSRFDRVVYEIQL